MEFTFQLIFTGHQVIQFLIDYFKNEYQEAKSLWDDQEALEACAFHWRLFAERYK
jgi:hypothetical protein